jgi:predicted Zn-ribbon and HTH transcriptional regulator
MHQHAPNPVARASNEVGDIARRWGDELRKCDILRSEELRALAALAACRTPLLGGHLDVCQACGFERPAYNSCRNRHCPKCQSLRQARWAETRQARVLPTHYFHVVFTLPAPLRPIALRHRVVIFDLLFAAASRTLLELGANTERLGAQLGITAVLHTWNQKIEFHPHLHCIVTGGGLGADGETWTSAPERFLFPVLVMGALFRGKLLALLREAIDEGRIDLHGEDSKALFDKLYRTQWVVYCKRPFGGPEQVIRYLSRYVHRVGISNQRIASVVDDQVVFRTKSGQPVTLAPLEFLRRLLQHVLPDRFVKIRHYGLHASSNATTRLERARELLSDAPASSPATVGNPRSWIELLLELTGIDVRLCSRCGADALQHLPLTGGRCPGPAAFDTS